MHWEYLKSKINQTYENIEVILVNDGSTDNSLSICKKYKKMMICSIILAISFLKVADEFDLDKAKRKVAKYLNRIDFTKEVVWDTEIRNTIVLSTWKEL